jgi:hypothetical protein
MARRRRARERASVRLHWLAVNFGGCFSLIFVAGMNYMSTQGTAKGFEVVYPSLPL